MWSGIVCVDLHMIVVFYRLWFGGSQSKEAVDWGKVNKMRRISEVSLPLSLIINYFPPYQEPRYVNLHVMDKDISEFDSCLLQIFVFNGCDPIIHLQEGREGAL